MSIQSRRRVAAVRLARPSVEAIRTQHDDLVGPSERDNLLHADAAIEADQLKAAKR